ncbi:hypothetical protein GLOTRDRAFT_108950 [Gloeophyllum trabeum ATCC 11539]|uniref:Uncharacterized protein n=1 Tax=Gloeophyllum trabeum (strain ATCC 11539 / FP-39264 / Madison 617) TaxID=670483 RepID=S7S3M3_GLOTA|nr:uncharacterized protein GLOTRDRAFT_108950 [Gloeophyllum trabeum ATCC 11539]EPQ60429.1 hypothetical protein GLOTRDRAFT_108950 [Gloeophyllum trabeum ATCC 11539]
MIRRREKTGQILLTFESKADSVWFTIHKHQCLTDYYTRFYSARQILYAKSKMSEYHRKVVHTSRSRTRSSSLQ